MHALAYAGGWHACAGIPSCCPGMHALVYRHARWHAGGWHACAGIPSCTLACRWLACMRWHTVMHALACRWRRAGSCTALMAAMASPFGKTAKETSPSARCAKQGSSVEKAAVAPTERLTRLRDAMLCAARAQTQGRACAHARPVHTQACAGPHRRTRTRAKPMHMHSCTQTHRCVRACVPCQRAHKRVRAAEAC